MFLIASTLKSVAVAHPANAKRSCSGPAVGKVLNWPRGRRSGSSRDQSSTPFLLPPNNRTSVCRLEFPVRIFHVHMRLTVLEIPAAFESRRRLLCRRSAHRFSAHSTYRDMPQMATLRSFGLCGIWHSISFSTLISRSKSRVTVDPSPSLVENIAGRGANKLCDRFEMRPCRAAPVTLFDRNPADPLDHLGHTKVHRDHCTPAAFASAGQDRIVRNLFKCKSARAGEQFSSLHVYRSDIDIFDLSFDLISAIIDVILNDPAIQSPAVR